MSVCEQPSNIGIDDPEEWSRMKRQDDWRNARAHRALVRMDSLGKGEQFIAMDGHRYTYDRVDGALSGVHHVTRSDGRKTAFAGCADVMVLVVEGRTVGT